MNGTDAIYVINVTERFGARSENGCRYAIKYIVDGEPGEEIAWLDQFLEDECDREVRWPSSESEVGR